MLKKKRSKRAFENSEAEIVNNMMDTLSYLFIRTTSMFLNINSSSSSNINSNIMCSSNIDSAACEHVNNIMCNSSITHVQQQQGGTCNT